MAEPSNDYLRHKTASMLLNSYHLILDSMIPAEIAEETLTKFELTLSENSLDITSAKLYKSTQEALSEAVELYSRIIRINNAHRYLVVMRKNCDIDGCIKSLKMISNVIDKASRQSYRIIKKLLVIMSFLDEIILTYDKTLIINCFKETYNHVLSLDYNLSSVNKIISIINTRFFYNYLF